MAGQAPVNVRTQRMIRLFLQPGGAGPLNTKALEGVGTDYAALTGRMRPVRGGIDNISVRNPTGAGFINVGSMEKNPGYGEVTLELRETITGLQLASTLQTCPVDIYEVIGSDCNQLSDSVQGYGNGGVVRVYPQCKISDNVDMGDGMAFTDDNPLSAKLKMSVTGEIFDHAQLFMGAQATANASDLATTLTTDVIYGNAQLCGNCGVPNDGTYLKYWAAQSTTSSPGAKPVVFYQLGNATPVAVSVTSAAVAENLTFIATVGSYLVVGSSTAGGLGIGGYHYAPIGRNGVPGSWTKVVAGFQSNHEPTDILVLSDFEIYFSANGGYIYKSTNLAAGVTVINAGANTTNNLLRIQGNRSQIVTVGASGTILISNSGGRTWAAPTATPAWGNPTVQAVDVKGQFEIWVGSATGIVYFTIDGGLTWNLAAPDGLFGTGSVTDIYWVNQNEGYILHNTGSAGRIFRTYDGGLTFWNQSPAIEGLGNYTSFSRIAAPTAGNESLKCNNIIIAGNNTGAQGLLLLGTPQVF